MGQITEKTYKAPDGSVFRVEADGSVTKIKDGKGQIHEAGSKYKITPDGKIYRVEDDGSVTYLGNAEDRQSPPQYATSINSERTGRKWGWIVATIILVVAGIIGIYVADSNSSSYDEYVYSNYEETATTSEPAYDGTVQSTEAYEQSYNHSSSEEIPANDDEQYAFICDGHFYGTIGNVRIHGNLTLDTENPSGVLYETSNYNEALELYGSPDGKSWSIYYNDENTGEIDFSFWNLAYKRFACGTFTRYSDGKQYTIELYKSNF